jgi:hypothetical protein
MLGVRLRYVHLDHVVDAVCPACSDEKEHPPEHGAAAALGGIGG